MPLPRQSARRHLPKFDCVLESGEALRVKYGQGPEPHAEVAATRLLRALGFGADRVSLVKRLRCHGCPTFPFVTLHAVSAVRAAGWYQRLVDYDQHVEFEWVAVERRLVGTPIALPGQEGVTWHELGTIRDARRAHVDAFRLLAVFLAHWDNKSENQQLLCLPDATLGRTVSTTSCAQPFLYISDAGATFGPRKVDLDGWRRAKIWRDRAKCLVSMEDLPYAGATFNPVRISEEGRSLLASHLERLSSRTDRDAPCLGPVSGIRRAFARGVAGRVSEEGAGDCRRTALPGPRDLSIDTRC